MAIMDSAEVQPVEKVRVREEDGGLWLWYSDDSPERWIGPRARAAIAEFEAKQTNANKEQQ